MSTVIAVDLGTTGVKAAAWNDDGTCVADAYRRRGVVQGPDGSVTQSPEETWELQNDVVREVARACPTPPDALVLTHQRGTFAPADTNGRALDDYIVWMDRRGVPVCDRLQETLGHAYYDRVLQPIQPYSGFSKMVVLEETGRSAPMYLPAQSIHASRLTGAPPMCDPSTASFLAPWQPGPDVWDAEICGQFNVSIQQLPAVVPSTTVVGHIHDQIADELGLPRGLPVVLGAADGQCAALGAGCAMPGRIMVNVGTATGVQAFLPTPLPHPDRTLNTAPHALPGAYEMEGHTQASGAAIDWLRTLLGDPGPGQLIAMAETTAPGANGVTIVPTFNGISAPISRPRAAASIHGLHLDHGPEHLARAMLEAVCYEARWILRSLERAVGPTTDVVLVGGFARSRWTGQLMADVLGLPLSLTAHDDAALTGAARLALMALDRPGDQLVHYRTRLEPNPDTRMAYDEGFDRFVRLVEAVTREETDD